MTEQDAADVDGESPTDEGVESTGADAEDAADREADQSAGEGDDALDDAVAVDEELVDRVAESDPEEVAREIAGFRTRVDGLEGELADRESEVDELASKLKRKQADFQNYKKRMDERREEERARAAADLVTRMLDVRDNLVRALEQDEDADIRGGVESTLRQFDDVLQAEDVETVEPDPGDDVDPTRHQVLARVDSDLPEGTVDDVHRPGYVMGETVLREAQVTVSEGGDGADAGSEDDDGASDEGSADGEGAESAPDGGGE